jgi:radical SAM superfamily enzyme YgiQ (UPF0313 family)
MLAAMRIAVRRGFKLSCFIIIGFPDETRANMRESLKLIRRMALLGVHDVAVSKFVPYPGSELFKRLQRENRIAFDDEFFLFPMDTYTQKVPSYSEHLTTAELYRTMLWMFINFYVISFACRPLRTAQVLLKAVVTGTEETRFAKWFNDRLFVRRRWRGLAAQAARGVQAAGARRES